MYLSSWSAINRIFRPGRLIGRSAVPPAGPVADSARFLINSSTLLTIININNITNSTSSAHVGYRWCITPSAPSDILISLLFSGFCSVSVLFLVLLLSPVYLLNPFLPRVDILSFSPIKTLLPPPLGFITTTSTTTTTTNHTGFDLAIDLSNPFSRFFLCRPVKPFPNYRFCMVSPTSVEGARVNTFP